MENVEGSPTIVVVAYNRPVSLERLLNSIGNATYNTSSVRLIISIDKGDNKSVLDVANNFHWKYGEKIIHYQSNNLGLREHILKCGDLTNQYGSVIILEDDLYVSENFYIYTESAIEYYKDSSKIAGISLYNQQFNETVKLPFTPLKNNFDVYFMQIPSSWGQVWTKEQWKRFREWYDKNKHKGITVNDPLPSNIIKWPESSWKKYFTKYIVEQDLFFVYPYLSLSTNFGDIGQHFWSQSSCYQAPLCNFYKEDYNFCELNESYAVYDVFCENVTLYSVFPEIGEGQVDIDLYGSKNNLNKRYLLTTKSFHPYKILKSYSLSLKPIEENVIKDIKGSQIFLYDTSIVEGKAKSSDKLKVELIEYFYPGIDFRKSIQNLFNKRTLRYIFIGVLKKSNQRFKKRK